MEGIVRLYNYLMIDLKHINKFCNYGIYKDVLEWKALYCIKIDLFFYFNNLFCINIISGKNRLIMDFVIKLNGLKSEFYNAFSEGFEEEDKEKDGIFEIIKFDEHITQQVIDAFNSQEYYPQYMEGIVRLYNYLMIDLEHINKFCNYGIYQDVLEWKVLDCMKINELNIKIMNEYTKNGLLKFMKYAHENDCPWNVWTCKNAVDNGHFECLKYAHENGCPWDETTCKNAARKGQLECLKYAHENGCPWNEYTCSNAAYYGHLNCLNYARENGCPE